MVRDPTTHIPCNQTHGGQLCKAMRGVAFCIFTIQARVGWSPARQPRRLLVARSKKLNSKTQFPSHLLPPKAVPPSTCRCDSINLLLCTPKCGLPLVRHCPDLRQARQKWKKMALWQCRIFWKTYAPHSEEPGERGCHTGQANPG